VPTSRQSRSILVRWPKNASPSEFWRWSKAKSKLTKDGIRRNAGKLLSGVIGVYSGLVRSIVTLKVLKFLNDVLVTRSRWEIEELIGEQQFLARQALLINEA
jgi:hypothetical protein